MGKTPRDNEFTNDWAIASVGGGGLIVGVNYFDLVNRETGRGHGLQLVGIGPSTKLGTAGAGEPGYSYFRTRKPASFDTFDGSGARLTLANIGIALGYSVGYLTVWDGPAYVGKKIAYVKMTGWGAMIPGGTLVHGVLTVLYGSGRPAGLVARVMYIEDVPDSSPRLISVQVKPNEPGLLTIPADVLFDFATSTLRSAAGPALHEIAGVLNRRDEELVAIVGHTDSKGKDFFNRELSLWRARAVKKWLVGQQVDHAAEFKIVGMGEKKPVASNTNPDGSDNPVGRQKNRRVEIFLDQAARNFLSLNPATE